MKIVLLQTGKTSEKYISEGVRSFESRLKKYGTFEIITLPDVKNSGRIPRPDLKEKEGLKIVSQFGKDDYVIILDEKGKEFSTLEFSALMQKLIMMHKKRIVFVIGGAYGVSKEVLQKADMCMSLSKMTFSHQLVRLLFAEQLYRVFTIIKGEPYHHE